MKGQEPGEEEILISKCKQKLKGVEDREKSVLSQEGVRGGGHGKDRQTACAGEMRRKSLLGREIKP